MANLEYYKDPEAESSIALSNVLLSNMASISSKLQNKFDFQKKKGENFARTRFLGIEPAKFRVSWTVYPEEEETFWRDVVPQLREKTLRAAAAPKNVKCRQINNLGIRQVVVTDVDIAAPNAKDGREVTCELQEWVKTTTKPNAKKAPDEIDTPEKRLNGESIYTRQG